MATEAKAQIGLFRIIRVDLQQHTDELIGDKEKRQAFSLSDEHNLRRTSSEDPVIYVFDDQGCYVRGNEDVDGPGACSKR
jgi:hypothetical protein